MNYKIIKNERALREFIEWLPDLQEDEKYYLSLFARKKYCENIIKSNDKTQLKRFVSNKERMYDKIKQLECEVGAYKLKDTPVPQQSLVLYITPNPRNMLAATHEIIIKAAVLLKNKSHNYNIHAETMSCIQRSKSKSYFCDFDIDDKTVDLDFLLKILPRNTFEIVETRGGYHVLVNTRLAPKDIKWHQIIRDTFPVDQVGDQLLPVPGCTQGGFTPRFII